MCIKRVTDSGLDLNCSGDSFFYIPSTRRVFSELTEVRASTQTPREMADASPSVADLAAMASLHVRSKSAGAAVELAGSNQHLGASPSPVPHHGGAPRGVSGFSGVTPVHGGEGGAKPGTLMTSPVSTLMLPALNLSVDTTPGFGGDVSMSPGGLTMNEEEPMTPFGAPTTAPFGPTPGADGVGWTPPPVDRSRETRKSTGGTRGKAKTGGFRHMGGMAHGEHDNDDDDMDEDDDWDAHDLASDDSLRADDDDGGGGGDDDTRTPPTTRRISVDSASTSTRAWPPRRRATASAAAHPGTQLCSRPSSTRGLTLATRTAGSARPCPSEASRMASRMASRCLMIRLGSRTPHPDPSRPGSTAGRARRRRRRLRPPRWRGSTR